jgi:hypothetical protein
MNQGRGRMNGGFRRGHSEWELVWFEPRLTFPVSVSGNATGCTGYRISAYPWIGLSHSLHYFHGFISKDHEVTATKGCNPFQDYNWLLKSIQDR